MGRQINVGCGPFPMPEPWENIDTHQIAADPKHRIVQASALDYDYTGATIVYAGHVVEHMTVPEAKTFFRRVRQQEAKDNQLIVTVPAIDRAYHASITGGLDLNALQDMVFGGRAYPGDEHRSAWRVRDLLWELSSAGYNKVGEFHDCPYLVAQVPWQVCIRAIHSKLEVKGG